MIADWRRKQSIIKTARLRPDLLGQAELTDEEWKLAQSCLESDR
jgi:tRNA G37 N-methylase TrmD